jgi:hypothetical protein
MDDQPKSSMLSAIVIYGLLVALVLGICRSVAVAPSGGNKGRAPASTTTLAP